MYKMQIIYKNIQVYDSAWTFLEIIRINFDFLYKFVFLRI